MKASLLASYTKGLPHEDDGLIADPQDFQQFIRGIDSGDPRDFQDTLLGTPDSNSPPNRTNWVSQYTLGQTNDRAEDGRIDVRAWESQGAGNTFDLEGPDAQAVTMPPAPSLDSAEFAAEVAEVYAMALLRDVPFASFETEAKVQTVITELGKLPWFSKETIEASAVAQRRRRLIQLPPNPASGFTYDQVFRGITPGDQVGPYISQFLSRGTPELGGLNHPLEGVVQYGALPLQNRVRIATPCKDYMTTWQWWLDVQNGADLRGKETYESGQKLEDRYRFIATPRDLATYVHYDALYEAYLNACLAMLALGIPFDPGIPFQAGDQLDRQQGFAQFGGPHILSLVTEVATRALKAVRFQKFNVHRRLRPEAIAGRVHRWKTQADSSLKPVECLCQMLDKTSLLTEIQKHNADQNNGRHNDKRDMDSRDGTYLLPMAFAEGSPMHPAYGAGHATVAGACVTILKAFFDHGVVLPKPYVQASTDGQKLVSFGSPELELTVEGELNKLASNISIGRNWAGVHYFTDYYESIRMGERIAIGILEEQKLTYGENFSMTVPLFDGGTIRI